MIAVEKTDQHKQQQQEQQNAHVGTHKRKQSEIINTRTNNKSTTQAPNSNNNSKNKENVNKNTVREKIRIIDEAYKKWTRESDNTGLLCHHRVWVSLFFVRDVTSKAYLNLPNYYQL